ncbi:MAG: aldose 1-epimerase family protein [Nocardioides sp.]|nr:aldose 1-epimerase family protein [Nocardioides sp.]
MPPSVTAPSGEQFVIESGGYRAVVTESGAALRSLTHHGRDLVDGFAEDAMSSGGRGQLLVPWPNRVRDGRYSYGGTEHQLALTEPSRHNASHGLARWAAWQPVGPPAGGDTVTLGLRLMAQTGYPWTLQLNVSYTLDESGLVVTQSARNLSGTAAPYASGAHPYLTAGPGGLDDWQLTCPASVRALSDPERLLPAGREDVAGTAYDFREPRRVGDVQVNHAFTGLITDAEGVAMTTLVDPGTGTGVALWVDRHHRWLMLYSSDDRPGSARRSLAVEPMTAGADAFNSGENLVTLEPGGSFVATWGIRAVG